MFLLICSGDVGLEEVLFGGYSLIYAQEKNVLLKIKPWSEASDLPFTISQSFFSNVFMGNEQERKESQSLSPEGKAFALHSTDLGLISDTNIVL